MYKSKAREILVVRVGIGRVNVVVPLGVVADLLELENRPRKRSPEGAVVVMLFDHSEYPDPVVKSG
jgi:hypothetical protein